MHGALRDDIHPHATKEQVKMFLALKCALWEKTTDVFFSAYTQSPRACDILRKRTYSVTQHSFAPRPGENLEHPMPPHDPHSATQHTFPLSDSTPRTPLLHVAAAAGRSKVGFQARRVAKHEKADVATYNS